MIRTHRTRLTPDANWLVGWDRDQLPKDTPSLVDASGAIAGPVTTFQPCVANSTQLWVRGFQLPPVKPGTYTLQFAESQGPTVEVVDLPDPDGLAPFEIHPTPKGTAEAIELAWKLGMRAVLQPGLHILRRALQPVPGQLCVLDGCGSATTLKRLPNDEDGHPMVWGGQDVYLRNLTLQPAYYVQSNWGRPPVTNTRYHSVTVQGGVLTLGDVEVYAAGCVFESCQVRAVAGLFHRCTVRGFAGNSSYFGGIPVVGRLAVIDCVWEDCDRGPTVNTNGGPFTDNLFAGIATRGLRQDNNGNEAFLVEGSGEFSRNLILHRRVSDCDGFVAALWGPARGNLEFDLIADGGTGYWFVGQNGAEQSGNWLESFELRDGGGIVIGFRENDGVLHGQAVTGNTFVAGSILGLRPSAMGNQGWPYPEKLKRVTAVEAVAGLPPESVASNVCQSVSFASLPGGVGPTNGVRADGCVLDGVPVDVGVVKA